MTHSSYVPHAEGDAIAEAIRKRRDDAQRWLDEDATSYLATVQRRDFETREVLTVGRSAESDVRIDDPAIEARHLSVRVLGDTFHVVAMGERARFRVGGAELRDASMGPGYIDLGRHLLRLSHQGFPAIVVFDRDKLREHARVRRRYFPIDLSYRYTLELTPDPHRAVLVILSTRGQPRRAARVGWFDVLIGRTPIRLEVTRLLEPGVGEEEYAVYFRDRTAGRETYEVGRYLDPQPTAEGRYILDFNLVYNPACAFSGHYNCPIPSAANLLPVEIRAGEMDPHGSDAS